MTVIPHHEAIAISQKLDADLHKTYPTAELKAAIARCDRVPKQSDALMRHRAVLVAELGRRKER